MVAEKVGNQAVEGFGSFGGAQVPDTVEHMKSGIGQAIGECCGVADGGFFIELAHNHERLMVERGKLVADVVVREAVHGGTKRPWADLAKCSDGFVADLAGECH